jgi:uncharacterized protein involved in response to NO
MHDREVAERRRACRQPGSRNAAGRLRSSRGRAEPYRIFFPAAMLHAAIMLPLALAAMTFGAPAGLASGPAHGTEMLAGFALAVIAGFLLPLQPRRRLAALLCLWIAGRAAVVADLPGFWAAAPSIGFAAVIAILIVPRFTRAAKKLRNKATGPLVGLIAGSIAAAAALVAAGAFGSARTVLYAAVTLLAALMLFMGGRIIAATAPGVLQRQGECVLVRVQPRLEGAMLVCFIPAIVGLAVRPLHPLAALGAGAAGVIGLIRLARWRPWRCRAHTDLWGLGAGYAWVCGGLLLLAASWLTGRLPSLLGLHFITVGGLGTLSLNVMGRTWLLRNKLDPTRVPLLFVGSALIALALVNRSAAILSRTFEWNWPAAAAWALAFFLALAALSCRTSGAFTRSGGADSGRGQRPLDSRSRSAELR